MSVDDSNKSLQIKFPGADSGMYFIFLVGNGVGRIDKTPLELTVTGAVNSISHSSGSYLGGTLITIGGINFSDDPLDNPVRVGDNWCLVQTSTPTEITCRVMETFAEETSTALVLTFLRTSEEAVNNVDNTYEFATPVATVTSLTSAFDEASNTEVLTLEGSGFGEDTDAVELYIDGALQTVVSCADTVATFTLGGMLDETSSNVQVYFPDGLPTGYTEVASLTVAPTLVSVSPATGSSGGTLLTITGTGFGTATEGVNLLQGAGGTEICDEVNITGYGTFTCLTKAMEIQSTDEIFLKTATGEYACGNTLAAEECSYEQLDASSPSVSAATISSSSTITVTGADFPTSGLHAVVLFQGMESDSAVIDDATQLTATFEHGIPAAENAAAPSVRFVASSTGEAAAIADAAS